MTILDKFDQDPRFQRLARRRNNFRQMVGHAVELRGLIVETGTAWDQDNWGGQGQSTLIWDWLVQQDPLLKAYSIDIRQEGIDTAQSQTTGVEFFCGDSVKTLYELSDNEKSAISVLYLDSFDWTPELNFQSALHHLAELTSVWSSLRSGCMVVVDDRHGEQKGKHFLVEAYMTALGIQPCFKNHQVGWIKP